VFSQSIDKWAQSVKGVHGKRSGVSKNNVRDYGCGIFKK
jgi:hypothetical protein